MLRGGLGWSGVAAAPVTELFPAKLTASMELARPRLAELPTGGVTPLAEEVRDARAIPPGMMWAVICLAIVFGSASYAG